VSRSSSSSSAPSTDRFRVFRQRLLILLSASVALFGISLIVISQFIRGAWHEGLVGIGIAIFATGPITVMIWWVTDDIYRGELRNTLRDVVSSALREANSIVHDCQSLGVVGMHLTRVDALNQFSGHILHEIERAERGQDALLWFVCTDLKGFLNTETHEFNPQGMIRAAAAQPTLNLRILMADPEYTVARSGDRGDSEEFRQRTYAFVALLQREYGIKAAAIRFYAFRPSVFAIATSRHMLLNPYPLGEQAHRCTAIIVTRTGDAKADGDARDIYSQYIRTHFERTWMADTTRGIHDPPPLVSRISLSKDDTDTNALLSREIADHSPSTADLLEFSGDNVRALLRKLAEAGTEVRLLLRHPDSVGRTQREKIISTYSYLKEHIFDAVQGSFQVRFYRTAATVRGRRLDTHLLNVGWYTPDISADGRISEWEIVGHLNPTITGDLRTSAGQALNEMFSRTFDGLWGSASVSSDVDRYILDQTGRDRLES
jgi:hypothetical protein